MTTLREMCNAVGIDDNPLECAFAIAGLIRTVLQREPSTLEGECASLLKATEVYGRMDDPAAIRRWLTALKRLPDVEVPDQVWLSLAKADHEED